MFNIDHTQNGNVNIFTTGNYSSTFVIPDNVQTGIVNLITDKDISVAHVSGLQQCLTSITGERAFCKSNLINLQEGYSYSINPDSDSQTSGSLLFGKGGVAFNCYKNIVTPSCQFDIKFQRILSSEYFRDPGDAEFSKFNAIACSYDNNYVNFFSGKVECDSLYLNKVNLVGICSTNTGIYAGFKGSIMIGRNSGDAFCATDLALNTIQNINLYDIQINLNSGYYAFAVKGENGVKWYADIEVLSLKTEPSIPITYGKYWTVNPTFPVTCEWFALKNWFTTSSDMNAYSPNSLSYPNPSTDVIMSGIYGSLVDLDNASWNNPNSIDTTRVTDPKGICFTSTTSKKVSSNIYGRATFYGNSSFR